MKQFESTLLREKFVITDPKTVSNANGNASIVALSNRMSFLDKDKKRYVVRTQNMHTCVRLTGKILDSIGNSDSTAHLSDTYEWDKVWHSITEGYETEYNPKIWGSIYYDGKLLFESGERHPFLDLIEKCQNQNDGIYEEAVVFAENAFKETGKNIKISYDGNVALSVNLKVTEGRCGVILRGATRTTTFNFHINATPVNPLIFSQCLNASASFLEGIQLCFLIGMNTEKIRVGAIARHSPEERQLLDAKKRLQELEARINNLERDYDVNYRPERPSFKAMINDAETFAKKVLAPN